jgi:hypothetical protein
MIADIYRPHTFAADVLLATRDLLGWGSSVADEDLNAAETEEGAALTALLGEAETQIAGLTTDPEGADDPVRSVRAAIALLYLAEADDPGGGWDDVAALLEGKLRRRPVPAPSVTLTCGDCDEPFTLPADAVATNGDHLDDGLHRPLCPTCAELLPGEAN